MLFATAVGAFGEQIESEAASQGISPSDLAGAQAERLRRICELLEVSCDWTRSVVTSRPEFSRRAQLIFCKLFEKGLVYRRESFSGSESERPWFFRRASFAEACARGLDELPSWTGEAREAQRAALGGIEGVEIDAMLIGGGQVPVFTPHTDAIGEGAFIAISPNHRAVETVASPADLEKLGNDASAVKMAQTEMLATVPGIDGLIPVVLTPSVDARFGPTICLGIPDRDSVDREIASRLVASPGLFRAAATNSKPRPAVRFRLTDRPISRVGTWGIPIPIVECESCGLVRADGEEVSACPKCGKPAKRDPQVIDGNFDSMWAWLSISAPQDTDFGQWSPAKQAVWSAPDGEQFLDERIAAIAVGASEPFEGACLCGAVNGDDGNFGVEELDELTAQSGSDAVRLTILHTASVSKPTSWSPATLRHSQRFLRELRDYAEPRLTSRERPVLLEIDPSGRLRRRLAAWCRIAEERVSLNLDRLEMHKATFGLMLFLGRIRDFEARCEEGSGMTPLDYDAVASALRRFARLAAPCIPRTAAELEAIAGEGKT